MHYASIGRRGLHTVLAAVALVSVGLAALAPSASAASKSDRSNSVPNSVTVNVQGGNAFALAACLNVIGAGQIGNGTSQQNQCQNHATAQGGDVTLKNVRITAVQRNASTPTLSSAPNSVNLTITGGNAAALAACLNIIEADQIGNGTSQQNQCSNVATAQGGDVTLKNVSVKVVQTA